MIFLSSTFDFSQIDERSLIIAFVGWIIVFAALVTLYAIFQNIPALVYYRTRREQRRLRKEEALAKKNEGKEVAEEKNEPVEISGELNAAISMALYLYFNDLHDEESNILTIKQQGRTYSPWSSKSYGVQGNQLHRK